MKEKKQQLKKTQTYLIHALNQFNYFGLDLTETLKILN